MISKWGVSNFKSIATTRVIDQDGNEAKDFTFKPLTILCGANSSGKSSLLQSLLLMAQTMRHPNKDIPLILNGAFTSLGKFDDIKSNICNNNDEIQVRFSYKPSEKYIFESGDYPFDKLFIDCFAEEIMNNADDPDEANKFHIMDLSFSIDFTTGKNEILPKISYFELSLCFHTYGENHSILKYYYEQNEKLKSQFYSFFDEDNTYYGIDPSFTFNQIFGSNPKVGDKVTLEEVFDKTLQGIDMMAYMRSIWLKEGVFVSFTPNRDNPSLSEYVIESYCNAEDKLNNILPEEKYEPNHFLPMNININGLHLISMLALQSIFRPMANPVEIIIPDEAREYYDGFGDYIDVSTGEAIKDWFYYAKNMTKNIFFYLKDEVLSDIQGIESLFDLKDFKFIDDVQGYPFQLWKDNFSSIQESIQHEIADKLKRNLHNIYKKIDEDLSNIIKIADKEWSKYQDMFWQSKEHNEEIKLLPNDEETMKEIVKLKKIFLDLFEIEDKSASFEKLVQEIDRLFKEKGEDFANSLLASRHSCENCPLGSDFKEIESCRKCFFYTDSINAKQCRNLFGRNFTVSKKIEDFLSEVTGYFSSDITYLGPLRDDPKLLYPINDSSYTNNIGKKGENTAAILALNCEKSARNPIPEWEASGKFKTEEKTLKEAIIGWLKYIGVAEDIEAQIEQGGFSLKIKTLGSSRLSDLTNVGVGVSQVLPIVVMCLSAKERATLIIEQPELHLHPKMQTKLTEFFIAVSQSGRQCIIETHSEHIINALRYQVAKTEAPHDDKLANDIQIYFAEKDENGSLFRSITIDKYAYISEWPENFFDEAQITNINTLKAINRKLEKDPPSE